MYILQYGKYIRNFKVWAVSVALDRLLFHLTFLWIRPLFEFHETLQQFLIWTVLCLNIALCHNILCIQVIILGNSWSIFYLRNTIWNGWVTSSTTYRSFIPITQCVTFNSEANKLLLWKINTFKPMTVYNYFACIKARFVLEVDRIYGLKQKI